MNSLFNESLRKFELIKNNIRTLQNNHLKLSEEHSDCQQGSPQTKRTKLSINKNLIIFRQETLKKRKKQVQQNKQNQPCQNKLLEMKRQTLSQINQLLNHKQKILNQIQQDIYVCSSHRPSISAQVPTMQQIHKEMKQTKRLGGKLSRITMMNLQLKEYNNKLNRQRIFI